MRAGRTSLGVCVILMAAIAASASAQAPSTATPPHVLILSNQARRFLALLFESSRVEFMGCMIGEVDGGVVRVERIAPADVAPSQATETWIVPTQSCEQAGWAGTVGHIHSHPSAAQCWYYFPNTQVATSDAQAFLHTAYPVDAILCGARVVWISRDMMQQQMPLRNDRDWNLLAATAR